MLLNLNDADSILAWWKVLPEKHDGFLDFKLRVSPEFAPAILEARRRIASTPELRGLLTESVEGRRQREAHAAAADKRLSAHELRYREFATA